MASRTRKAAVALDPMAEHRPDRRPPGRPWLPRDRSPGSLATLKPSMNTGLGNARLGLNSPSIHAWVPETPTIATEATASQDEMAGKPAHICQRRCGTDATGRAEQGRRQRRERPAGWVSPGPADWQSYDPDRALESRNCIGRRRPGVIDGPDMEFHGNQSNEMVDGRGFEPPTPALRTPCSPN